MLSEIRQRQILHDLGCLWNLEQVNSKKQRAEGQMPRSGQVVQSSGYKMGTFWRPDVRLSDKVKTVFCTLILPRGQIMCPLYTLCDPMDCGPPVSSFHWILQARILEWVAFPFSMGSSQPGIKPRSPALQADSLPSEPPGKPPYISWPYIYKRNLIHNLKSYYPDTKPHKDITKK